MDRFVIKNLELSRLDDARDEAVALLAKWGVEAHAFVRQTEMREVEWVKHKDRRANAIANPHAAAAIYAAQWGGA